MAIVNVGDSQSFAYTGNIQTLTVPVTGIYKLAVVGANGAHNLTSMPKGGYSVGYKEFKKGTVLYIGVGQAGAFDGKAAYNGGGAGIKPTGYVWNNPSGSGGGATHIAIADGTLEVLRVSDDSQILIVAGGGGGESGHPGSGIAGVHYSNGGYGGGTSGGQGGTSNGNPNWYTNPGTQTGGGGKGYGAKATNVGSVADGTDAIAAGGGGGGYWGGYAGVAAQSGGSGGSGYIDGVPASLTYKGMTYTAFTQGNYNTQGNGRASIELIAKTTLPVTFDGTTLESIVFNGTEITSLIFDGTKLFFEHLKRRFAAWYTSMKPTLNLKAST